MSPATTSPPELVSSSFFNQIEAIDPDRTYLYVRNGGIDRYAYVDLSFHDTIVADPAPITILSVTVDPDGNLYWTETDNTFDPTFGVIATKFRIKKRTPGAVISTIFADTQEPPPPTVTTTGINSEYVGTIVWNPHDGLLWFATRQGRLLVNGGQLVGPWKLRTINGATTAVTTKLGNSPRTYSTQIAPTLDSAVWWTDTAGGGRLHRYKNAADVTVSGVVPVTGFNLVPLPTSEVLVFDDVDGAGRLVHTDLTSEPYLEPPFNAHAVRVRAVFTADYHLVVFPVLTVGLWKIEEPIRWLEDLDLYVAGDFFIGIVSGSGIVDVIHKVTWTGLELDTLYLIPEAAHGAYNLDDITVDPDGYIAVGGAMAIGETYGRGVWGITPNGAIHTRLYEPPTTAKEPHIRRSHRTPHRCYLAVSDSPDDNGTAVYSMVIRTGARELLTTFDDAAYKRFWVGSDDALWWNRRDLGQVHRWTPSGGMQVFHIAGIQGAALVPLPSGMIWAVRRVEPLPAPFHGIAISPAGVVSAAPCMDVFEQPIDVPGPFGGPTRPDAIHPHPTTVGTTPGAYNAALIPHDELKGGLWGKKSRGVSAVIATGAQLKSLAPTGR